MTRKTAILASIIAPFPPPIGGIASLAQWLRQELGGRDDLQFSSLPAKSVSSGLARNFSNLRIVWQTISTTSKAGVVMAFSSAGFSFYEKLTWAVLARLRGRFAALVMVDGNFPRWWATRTKLVKQIVPKVIRKMDIQIVGQSEKWRSYYADEFNLRPGGIIGATAPKDFFDLAPQRFAASETLPVTILFAGWMIHDKGVDDLLQAKALMQLHGVPVHLSFIGPEFDGQPDWRARCDALGIADTVQIHGKIEDRTQLLNHFLTADIFVLPSHAEGFSVALVEAVASGLPAIASDVGGASDTIIDGETGFVVPAQDPVALAAAMDRLCSRPALRKTMSLAAAEHANRTFSERAALEKYCAVLGIKEDI